MGRYLEMLRSDTDTEGPARNCPDCEKSEITNHRNERPPILREIAALPLAPCRVHGCPEHAGPSALADGPNLERYSRDWRVSMPLRRCGALVCRDCHAHSPGPHREGCRAPRFGPCRSRWFWLSPYRAIKCVACSAPADLDLVEGWVLARETGEGDDGWRIPDEILSLLHVHARRQ